MKMKANTQDSCNICNEVLGSHKRTTLIEILEPLKILIENINSKFLHDSLICEPCLAKVQLASTFKSSYSERSQKHNLNIEEIDAEKCEICKNVIAPSDCVPLFDSATDNKLNLIKYLSEELESKVYEDAQACESCHKSLLNFYTITKSLCIFDRDNEVWTSELNKTIVNKEFPHTNTYLNNAKMNENFKADIEEQINCMSQNVKEEMEDNMGYNQADLRMERDNLEDELIWRHSQQEETLSNSKDFQCVWNRADFDEFEMFQCHICTYRTKSRRYLKRHMLIHKSADEVTMFKCELCRYETKHKRNLNSHLLGHKNVDEVVMFKCDSCQYQTKHKNSLKRHLLIHKNNDEVEMFKCHLCEYETKTKSSLKKHSVLHKSSDEVEIFQCEVCQFRTKHKWSIRQHMLTHKPSDEIEMFKCEICDFKTKFKSSLKEHAIIHKNSDEVTRFRCEICGFETKHRRSLREHLITHKNSDEVETFKCPLCKYETKTKCSLKKHSITHNSSEAEMFRCEMCEFQTKHKRYLNRIHMLIHKKADEIDMFKCQICEYETKTKLGLKRHSIIHKDSNEIETFQCYHCKFETKYKHSLSRHLFTHAV